MANYKTKLCNIKAFAFDVDGVLTDGRLISMPDGDLLRQHNTKDGYAIRVAVKKGYKIAIISGGVSESVRLRYSKLGVEDIFMGSDDKLPIFKEFCQKYNLNLNEVVYGGDDIPDIPVLKHCGLSFCPADAVHEVKDCVDYISGRVGGDACVRDIIEQVLTLQGKWYKTEE